MYLLWLWTPGTSARGWPGLEKGGVLHPGSFGRTDIDEGGR